MCLHTGRRPFLVDGFMNKGRVPKLFLRHNKIRKNTSLIQRDLITGTPPRAGPG